MSVASFTGTCGSASAAIPTRTMTNLWRWGRVLLQPRGDTKNRRFLRPAFGTLALWTALTIVAVLAAMLMLDPLVMPRAQVPAPLVAIGEFVSRYLKGDWVMIPAGALLLAAAALASPALGRATYGVLLRIAARASFVLLAVALPGLTVSIVKRLIGRARPGRFEGSDLYFMPFSWKADFASFPSGHATTAFAAAVALGALFPRARWAFFAYAAVMALSRIVVAAHYPSDVIAGAVFGGGGALLVRAWFASRRLGFCIATDKGVTRLPGPSRRRLARAVRAALSGTARA